MRAATPAPVKNVRRSTADSSRDLGTDLRDRRKASQLAPCSSAIQGLAARHDGQKIRALTRPCCDGWGQSPTQDRVPGRGAAACDGPLFTLDVLPLPGSRPASAGGAYLAFAMGMTPLSPNSCRSRGELVGLQSAHLCQCIERAAPSTCSGGLHSTDGTDQIGHCQPRQARRTVYSLRMCRRARRSTCWSSVLAYLSSRSWRISSLYRVETSSRCAGQKRARLREHTILKVGV